MDKTITQQQIIDLAVEAGMSELLGPTSALLNSEIAILQRFATLVAEREREACAKVCEDEACGGSAFNSASKYMANRIRARGAKGSEKC